MNDVHGAHLTRQWQEFKKAKFDITLDPRLEHAYFGKGLSIHVRISALIKAQKLIEADKVKARKLLEDGEFNKRKRKFDGLEKT